MNIQWPSTQVKDTADLIREAVGRLININVKVPGIECTHCTEDPVTHMSTDSFCIFCSGLHWINTLSGYPVKTHVRWIKSDIPAWQTGGKLPKGDCIVTMEYTANNLYSVENAHNFEVDDHLMQMNGFDLRGAPTPNRIRVTLTEINN